MDDANLDLVIRGVLFAAVGTAGQRCTSNRRLFVHEKIYPELLQRLLAAYKQVRIGDPIQEEHILCGPLHSSKAVQAYERAIKMATEQGGSVAHGGRVLNQRPGFFVEPTVITFKHKHATVQEAAVLPDICCEETFAPILYVFRVSSLEEAISLNNAAHHGLSSSLFTSNFQNVFKWIGPNGSDCGIVNGMLIICYLLCVLVNIGTSGAEIGLAFMGHKYEK